MNQPTLARFGSLDGYLIEPSRETSPPPSAIVVLCHGYGAPGSDMVGVVGEWLRLLGEVAESIRFICPIAPLSLAELGMPSARAWWPLNMERMMQAVQAESFEELHRHEPAGLDEARGALAELIRTACGELAEQRGIEIDSVPVAMGGFSQGAMVSMDTALRGDISSPDLLFQFSGTLICQRQWTEAMERLSQTRVYQAHGTLDPILPFSSAERLRDLLGAAKVDARFHAFEGPHTIDGESIAATAQALQQWVAGV